MRCIALVVAIPVLFGLTASLGWGQASSKLFDAVPIADRESLREAVSKSVSYQINRNWAAMYELYDNQKNKSLEQFVRDMKTRIKLVEFNPKAVAYIPPSDHWLIEGCAVFAYDIGDKGTVDAVISARHLPDGWRLSEVAISPRKDGQECTSKRR